jgi:hypothetical protein
MNMEEKSVFESFELEVTKDIKGFLKETATWSYFLSIMGFIGIGIMVIFGIFFGAIMGSRIGGNPYQNIGFSMGYLGLIYVVFGLLYFFPVYYLFNFSKKMKSALKSNNNDDFKAAFLNLKSHYKYLGIFTITIISIYVLAFVFGLLAASMF